MTATKRKKKTAHTVPYGEVIDPDTDAVIKDPDQQEVIDKIILDYYYIGIGFKGIANTLNNEGIPTARGRKWYASTVKKVWDATTNGRVKRVMRDYEKAQQEAADAFAASPEGMETAAMVEKARREEDPEHQFKTKDYFFTDGATTYDKETGELTSHLVGISKKSWDKMKAEQKAAEDAYKTLTFKQRADRHEFRDPVRAGFGKSCEGVDDAVTRGAERVGEEFNYWLDAIKGQLTSKQQATIKRKLRVAAKHLLAELAIQHQLALHYQQERDWVLEVTKLTMETVRMAREGAREKPPAKANGVGEGAREDTATVPTAKSPLPEVA